MNAFVLILTLICGIMFYGNGYPYQGLLHNQQNRDDYYEDYYLRKIPKLKTSPDKVKEFFRNHLSWFPVEDLEEERTGRRPEPSRHHPKRRTYSSWIFAVDECPEDLSLINCNFSKHRKDFTHMKDAFSHKLKNFTENHHLPHNWTSIKSQSSKSMHKVQDYLKHKHLSQAFINMSHPLRYRGSKNHSHMYNETDIYGNKIENPCLHIHPKSSHVEVIKSSTTVLPHFQEFPYFSNVPDLSNIPNIPNIPNLPNFPPLPDELPPPPSKPPPKHSKPPKPAMKPNYHSNTKAHTPNNTAEPFSTLPPLPHVDIPNPDLPPEIPPSSDVPPNPDVPPTDTETPPNPNPPQNPEATPNPNPNGNLANPGVLLNPEVPHDLNNNPPNSDLPHNPDGSLPNANVPPNIQYQDTSGSVPNQNNPANIPNLSVPQTPPEMNNPGNIVKSPLKRPSNLAQTKHFKYPVAQYLGRRFFNPRKFTVIIDLNGPEKPSKLGRNANNKSYLSTLEDTTNTTKVLETAGEVASDLAGRVTNLWHCVLGSHRIPDTRDVKFYLYTRRNIIRPELLSVNYDLIRKKVKTRSVQPDVDCLDIPPEEIGDFERISDENRQIIRSNFLNLRAPTKILIHGYTGSYKDSRMAKIKDAYLDSGRYNVILVDWEMLAAPPCYIRVTHHSKFVGETIAKFLDGLHLAGLNMSMVHLVGFSLGAQVAGFAGNNATLTPVCRITGLDPALPLFLHTQSSGHLDKFDAKFVDVIHTCGGILAMLDPLGHVDFYPNGGTRQPGCEFSNLKCSHSRAPQYFAESINSQKKFTGQLCMNWEEYVAGDCNNATDVSFMGEPCSRRSAFGKYYLLTKSKEPFVV